MTEFRDGASPISVTTSPSVEGGLFHKMMKIQSNANEVWNQGIPNVEYGGIDEVLFSHLLNAGVPIDKLNKLFFVDGSLRGYEGKQFQYDQVGYAQDGRALIFDADRTEADIADGRMSVEGFLGILKNRYKEYFSLINTSADQGYEGGFNNHGGDEHIIPVTMTAWELSRDANLSVEQQKVVIAAGMSHDLGMLLGRKIHPFVSMKIATLLVPELVQNTQTGFDIKKAIVLHDEGAANNYMKYIVEQEGCGWDTPKFYDAIEKKFGAATLALIAADKADAVNRRRATLKAGVDKSVLMSDSHTATSVLGDGRGYEVYSILGDREKEIRSRTLQFMPYLSEAEEKQLYTRYAVGEGKHERDVAVPYEYRELHREYGIPHFFSWQADIWKNTTDRFGLEARALFTLFPKMDMYKLLIEDKSAWETDGFKSTFTYGVKRDEVEPFMNLLKTKMAFPEKKQRLITNMPEVFIQEAENERRIDVNNEFGDFARKNRLQRNMTIEYRLMGLGNGEQIDFEKNIESNVLVKYTYDFSKGEVLQAYIDKMFKPYRGRKPDSLHEN